MIAGNPDINSDTLGDNELSIDYSVDGDPCFHSPRSLKGIDSAMASSLPTTILTMPI
jgi:hypothetical protein